MNEAIKRAIEGGWLSEISPNIEYVNGDFSGGIRYGYCELGLKENGVGKNTSYQKVSLGTILLDPLFWQALGKACGWEGLVSECHNAGTTRYPKDTIQGNGSVIPEWYDWCLVCKEKCRIVNKIDWKDEWHRFIDHLAEGKDADSFFTNLLK